MAMGGGRTNFLPNTSKDPEYMAPGKRQDGRDLIAVRPYNEFRTFLKKTSKKEYCFRYKIPQHKLQLKHIILNLMIYIVAYC